MCKVNPLIVAMTTTVAAASSTFALVASAETIGVLCATAGGTALIVASVALTVATVALIVFTAISATTLIMGAIQGEYKRPETICYFFEMMQIVMATFFRNIASICPCS